MSHMVHDDYMSSVCKKSVKEIMNKVYFCYMIGWKIGKNC